MKNIKKAIQSRCADLTTPDFREVAGQWAVFCLKNYEGQLLHRSLALAEALAMYQDEFDKCTGVSEGAAH